MLNSTSYSRNSVAGSCKKIRKFQLPEAASSLLTTKVTTGLSRRRVSVNFSKFVSGYERIWHHASVCYTEKHVTRRNTWSPKVLVSPFSKIFVSYCSFLVFSGILT